MNISIVEFSNVSMHVSVIVIWFCMRSPMIVSYDEFVGVFMLGICYVTIGAILLSRTLQN